MRSGYAGTPDNWRKFLIEWEALRKQFGIDNAEEEADFLALDTESTKGKTEEIIRAIEETDVRLGIQLAQSYKDVMLATNGEIPEWFLSGIHSDRLRPFHTVNWFEKCDPKTFNAFIEDEDEDALISDEDYCNIPWGDV